MPLDTRVCARGPATDCKQPRLVHRRYLTTGSRDFAAWKALCHEAAKYRRSINHPIVSVCVCVRGGSPLKVLGIRRIVIFLSGVRLPEAAQCVCATWASEESPVKRWAEFSRFGKAGSSVVECYSCVTYSPILSFCLISSVHYMGRLGVFQKNTNVLSCRTERETTVRWTCRQYRTTSQDFDTFRLGCK